MYTTGKIIGNGGFGYVREGVGLHGEHVALKYIPKTNIGNQMGMIPLEVALMRDLRNVEGVIKIVNYWETASEHVIVMERPALSQDLLSYIREHGTLSEKKTKIIFRQLVDTLLRIHARGICHRDLKPSNIILDLTHKEPVVKIIDFGNATRFDPQREDATYTKFMGTEKYAPPEWINHKKTYSRASDTWCLGVTLCEMVTGDFKHEWLANGTLFIPKKLPTEFRRLLYGLLETCVSLRTKLINVHGTKWMQRKYHNYF